MGDRRCWRLQTAFLFQFILATQGKVIVSPGSDEMNTTEVPANQSAGLTECQRQWEKAMNTLTRVLCGNCNEEDINELIENCPNVTVPGKPKIILPSNPHERVVIDGEYGLRPKWGLPMFSMDVSWEHPPDSENLLGYQVTFAAGKKFATGGEDFHISKDITSVTFGLELPRSEDARNRITLLPREFFSGDFMGSKELYYTVKVLALPIRGNQRLEGQMDAVSFELPGCDTTACSCLKQRLEINGMNQKNQSCADDCCADDCEVVFVDDDPSAVKTVKLCACGTEAKTNHSSNCSIFHQPIIPSIGPPAPTSTSVSTTMLTSAATETPSSGEEVPGGVHRLSASVVVPAAIAGTALAAAAFCLAMVFAWQRRNVIGAWRRNNPGLYLQVSKCSSASILKECAAKGKPRHNSSVSTVLTDATDVRPMPYPVTVEDFSGIAPAPGVDGPGVYISYSRYTGTGRSDAARLYAELRRHGFHAILDVYQENTMSDDRQGWITDRMMTSRHVLVLLDSTHPLNMPSDTLRAQILSDDHNSCRDAILEGDIIRSCHYSGKSPPSIIPVCIGTAAGSDAVIPSMLKSSTVYRLPHDFDAGPCQWFQQLTSRLLTNGKVAWRSEEL